MKPQIVDEPVSIARAFDPEPDARGNHPQGQAPNVVELEHERIAVRAYELFHARGGQHGDDLRDWLDAEQEVRESRP